MYLSWGYRLDTPKLMVLCVLLTDHWKSIFGHYRVWLWYSPCKRTAHQKRTTSETCNAVRGICDRRGGAWRVSRMEQPTVPNVADNPDKMPDRLRSVLARSGS